MVLDNDLLDLWLKYPQPEIRELIEDLQEVTAGLASAEDQLQRMQTRLSSGYYCKDCDAPLDIEKLGNLQDDYRDLNLEYERVCAENEKLQTTIAILKEVLSRT